MPVAMTSDELKRIQDDYQAQLPDRANRLTLTRTADGQGGWTETWGTVAENVPCRVVAKAGRELMAGGALQAYHSYTLVLPHDETVLATDRWEVGSVTYAVVSADSAKSSIFGLRVEVEQI